VWLAWFTDSIARWERQAETPYLMDEPRSSSATAPDTASSPAPPDAQQISSDPEPDADDWDVEPGSRKGDSSTVASGVAAAAVAARGDGGTTIDEDELDDLKRIEEQSRNLELSLSWEDVDEELREFLASGDEDEDDEEDEEDGDGDDAASSKGGMKLKSEKTGERDRRAGDETGRCGSFYSLSSSAGFLLRPPSFSKWALYTTNEAQTAEKYYPVGSWVELKRR
jgi:RNA polymerase II subunit A-like phosphatase